MSERLCLGIDLSTQSVTATLIGAAAGGVVLTHALNYNDDPRLNRFGLDRETYILPPRVPGEADQHPLLYLAALDALFADLASLVDLGRVAGIACSAQQHGHVYLKKNWVESVAALDTPDAGVRTLEDRMRDDFAADRAPIWKTSDTAAEASLLREAAGGRDAMILLSGSDSPLRFTGAMIRRRALKDPAAYADSASIRLLSTFLAAVLSGNPDAPSDWGNAAGTSLMDYPRKTWSDALLGACANGLAGGTEGLRGRLGALSSPLERVGTAARYFTGRYGLAADAVVFAGSGDNPQTKVLVEGDLLSLGTSFVTMVSTDGGTDPSGAFNAMYDGLGRPFMFGCRTNGALVWDRVRSTHGVGRKDYAASDAALLATPVGSSLVLWQPDEESFPRSPAFELRRLDGGAPGFASDYAGVVDSSLALVYLASRDFSTGSGAPLCVTGGPTASPEILKRIAAIWNRPVKPIGLAGASTGAACAAAIGLGAPLSIADSCVESGTPVTPDKVSAAALRSTGGFFERLNSVFLSGGKGERR